MIVITEIKYKRFLQDRISIHKIIEPFRPVIGKDENEEPVYSTVEQITEEIRGVRMVTPQGEECFGLPEDVAKILGFSYKILQKEKDKAADWKHAHDRLESRHNMFYKKVISTSLWTRIKWVFKGVEL